MPLSVSCSLGHACGSVALGVKLSDVSKMASLMLPQGLLPCASHLIQVSWNLEAAFSEEASKRTAPMCMLVIVY